jgi:hypothetical protein
VSDPIPGYVAGSPPPVKYPAHVIEAIRVLEAYAAETGMPVISNYKLYAEPVLDGSHPNIANQTIGYEWRTGSNISIDGPAPPGFNDWGDWWEHVKRTGILDRVMFKRIP